MSLRGLLLTEWPVAWLTSAGGAAETSGRRRPSPAPQVSPFARQPIHGATASFGGSKAWLQLTGGRFAGHAPGTYDLLIDIPITEGVGPFTVNDEEYTYKFAEGVQRHVVAKFRERPAKTSEKNSNNDILWTIDAGKGRVFHCGLGHDVKAWANPSFQKLILQGVHWAAGKPKSVTIPK